MNSPYLRLTGLGLARNFVEGEGIEVLAESPADPPEDADAFGPVRLGCEPLVSLQAAITTTMAAVISAATRLVTTRFILPPRSVRLGESNMPSGTSIGGREVTAARM